MKPPSLAHRASESNSESSVRPWLARRFSVASVDDRTVTFGKNRDLLVASVVALAIPYLASVFIPLGVPIKDRVDPSGYWFLPTLHQVVAALLAVVAIRLVSTKPLAEWGFNLRHWGKSLALVAAFAAITIGPIYLLARQAPPASGSMTVGAIVAVLVTHLLVIGTTQEILYRGFLLGFLQRQWGQARLLGISHAGWWATLVFVASHIKPYPPFVWPAQLGLSLFYGFLYARITESTGSLLGASLAHGFSNAAYIVCLMLFKG
jgi:membrane protease YdiL (CAAX protease family)